MRRALVSFSCSIFAACGEDVADSRVERDRSAIAYGQADTTHSAVVALLASGGGTTVHQCTGTIVQVRAGFAYVLTAAHCCNASTPSVAVMSDDYFTALQYVGRTAPLPPAYAITAGSVFYDARYGGSSQPYDFCMLKFPAPAGTASIGLPTGPDGLALGQALERIGYGSTEVSDTSTTRRTATAPVDQALSAATFTSSQGGGASVPGICLGDSGGPVLAPAGAAAGTQIVVGVASYSDSATCSQNTLNVSMRVTSATGDAGFIGRFLADAPIGTAAASLPSGCFTCTVQAQTGTCAAQTQTCLADPACTALPGCLSRCSSQACATACRADAGSGAVTRFNDYRGCICFTDCRGTCQPICGNPPLDAGQPVPDAGVDAGVRDAGVRDAGPRDAGPPDAGAFDAGSRDAGLEDAGGPDAGLDAGASDAGRPPLLLLLIRAEGSVADEKGCSAAPGGTALLGLLLLTAKRLWRASGTSSAPRSDHLRSGRRPRRR